MMRKLKKPDIKMDTVITACISNYSKKNENLKKRFEDSIDEIEKYTVEFEKVAVERKFYQFSSNISLKTISDNEMIKLYEDKFSRLKQGGKKYYNEILKLAPGRKCPYCAIREVSTLDHYMSKSLYPVLAVSPINLIPACKDCNVVKSSIEYKANKDTHIHPYFEDVDNEIWLEASFDIDNENDIIFTYKVIRPNSWDDELYERVKNHFKVFKLNKNFTYFASEIVRENKNKLAKLLINSKSKDAVYDDIRESLESSENNGLNSYQTALYQAILEDKRFVDIYISGVAKELNIKNNK
jgi:5-methylcytosine-specific restriction endonuclease McrA